MNWGHVGGEVATICLGSIVCLTFSSRRFVDVPWVVQSAWKLHAHSEYKYYTYHTGNNSQNVDERSWSRGECFPPLLPHVGKFVNVVGSFVESTSEILKLRPFQDRFLSSQLFQDHDDASQSHFSWCNVNEEGKTIIKWCCCCSLWWRYH